MRGSILVVKGDRHEKSSEISKVVYNDASNLYGRSMSHPLFYEVIALDSKVP